MSISNLFTPNIYELFCNSLTTNIPIIDYNISGYYNKSLTQIVQNNLNSIVYFNPVSEISSVTYNNGIFNINRGGVYSFTYTIIWDTTSGGSREIFFFINQSIGTITQKYQSSNIPSNSSINIFNSNTLVSHFNTGDTVGVAAYQSSGSTANIVNLPPNNCQLIVSRLS